MRLWPTSATQLVDLQEVLGQSSPEPWEPAGAGVGVLAGVFWGGWYGFVAYSRHEEAERRARRSSGHD